MLTNNSRSWIVIGLWFAAVVAIFSASIAAGARPLTLVLLIPLSIAPLAVAYLIMRRTQAPTIAQEIHAVTGTKGGRS